MNLHSISFRVLISFRSISPLPSELRFSLSHGNEWTRFDEHSLRFTEGEREGALCRIAAKATLSVNQEFSIAIFSRKRDATIPFPEFSFASIYKIFHVTTCILDCIILSKSNCIYSFEWILFRFEYPRISYASSILRFGSMFSLSRSANC